MKLNKNELKDYYLLWSTQSLSTLGSSLTTFALILWIYQHTGSALGTALLSVFSYLPYVLMSLLSGVISDMWNKKIILLCSDSFAAICTFITLLLVVSGELQIWHLYVLNGINGFMNSIQQPASEIVTTLLVPKHYYQRVSGLQSLSSSLTSVLTPMLATMFMSIGGVKLVILLDLLTFVIAMITLFLFIKLPIMCNKQEDNKITLLQSMQIGMKFLRKKKGILYLMFFLAMINLIASMYQVALPVLILSKSLYGVVSLGIVQTASGLALLAGSILATLAPKPKNRVKVICNTLLFAMSTENFFLAFGDSVPVWCIGTILGWSMIPFMNANLNVIFREQIPIELQGRVFSLRNAFQFFTIPIGYFLGGVLIDYLFEPFMENNTILILNQLFGFQKGSGTALLFLFLASLGMITCFVFRRSKEIRKLE